MYQSGRAGDEAKKRKSPAKSGRVGITGVGACNGMTGGAEGHISTPHAPCPLHLNTSFYRWSENYHMVFFLVLSLLSIVPFHITCYVGTGKKILRKGEYNPAGDRLVVDLEGEGKAGATELACFGFGSFRCAWGLSLSYNKEESFFSFHKFSEHQRGESKCPKCHDQLSIHTEWAIQEGNYSNISWFARCSSGCTTISGW